MNALWSYLLTAVGLLIFWLAGNKRWEAWLLGLFNQVLWVSYAIATDQYGWIIGAAAYGAMYARNLRKWLNR